MRITLAAALACCASLLGNIQGVAAQSATITKKDREFYTQGAFAAYASPWSTFYMPWLQHLVHYEDTITIDPSRFPANTVIRTRWPTVLPSSGVWGYHHLALGNYDGEAVQRPIVSRQVRDIRRLQVNWGVSYSGSPNFNLLNEFYLTSQKGNNAAKVLEIGIFPHVPLATQRYVEALPSIPYVDVWGRAWRLSRAGKFVMLTPARPRDMSRDSFDFLHLLKFLKSRGVVTGNEWFNGIGFGTEPTVGAGVTTLQIQKLQVEYD